MRILTSLEVAALAVHGKESALPELVVSHEALRYQVRHMAEVHHQAWHADSAVGWQECTRAFCADAARATGDRR